ncbi:MAG: hypothetical protein M3Y27_19530 [Acidobacteriota bacterium]|nr:hypothetical protein [Acidobacteriota bacterium]
MYPLGDPYPTLCGLCVRLHVVWGSFIPDYTPIYPDDCVEVQNRDREGAAR